MNLMYQTYKNKFDVLDDIPEIIIDTVDQYNIFIKKIKKKSIYCYGGFVSLNNKELNRFNFIAFSSRIKISNKIKYRTIEKFSIKNSIINLCNLEIGD